VRQGSVSPMSEAEPAWGGLGVDSQPMEIHFGEAARRHWNDALFLRENKRPPNADQLFGFSAECALKAVMISLGAPTSAGGDLSERSHWRHIDALWGEFQAFASGRRGSRSLSALTGFAENPFSDWHTSQRYGSDSSSPSGAALETHRKPYRACLVALERAAGGT
jgi:hypothetical protein